MNLYKSENLKMDYGQLLSLARQTDVNVTKENICVVEAHTKSHYKSRLWNCMRAGRVTASKLKTVCHTDPASPSVFLVMSICHPELHRFETPGTRWGCSHEKDAIECFSKIGKDSQINLKVSASGFVISEDYPFIGASPDGFVSCQCCGDGVLEVKVSRSLSKKRSSLKEN